MKTYLLAAVAVFAMSQVAHAADFIPDPGYDWTGVYAGLNAGYAWTDTSGTDIDGWTVIDGETINADGGAFVGGAQLGYNWQSNSLVGGVETDINYVGGSDTGTNMILFDLEDVSFGRRCGFRDVTGRTCRRFHSGPRL